MPRKKPKLNSSNIIAINDTLVLMNQYDLNQFWLPFVHAVFVNRNTTIFVNKNKHKKLSFNQSKYITSDEYKELFPMNVKGQFPLPFKEFLEMNYKDFQRYMSKNLIGFDKDSQGKPLTILYNKSDRNKLRIWCTDSCKGRFFIGKEKVWFSHKEDMILAKLFFGK